MTYPNPASLVSTAWLADNLDNDGLRIVDATWFLPGVERDARAEFEQRHIPGAVFWDIDEIADAADPLPHMLPDATIFAGHMAALGIGDGIKIVVYDGAGIGTAPRVWWTLRTFGHDDVAVLDGGLPKWLAEERPVDQSPPGRDAGAFTARIDPAAVRSLEQIRANIDGRTEQVLDARAAGRYAGTDPEPRPGIRSGHIPGSLSLPYTDLIDPDSKTMRPAHALAARFAAAGLDMARPVVTSCGSGVTACVLALALDLLGHGRVAVYDGSWTEWGGRDDTPIET